MKIKGFDKNLRCRGMQYEIGKEYKTGAINLTKADLCTNKVLHYCDSLMKVHMFYNCDRDNRYCEIEVLGEECTDGCKFGSNHIRVVREIVGDELNTLMGKINGNTGKFNTGNWNTGDRNSGNWNTGNWNTGDWNTGNFNTGDWNTGDCNTGNFNTGDCNTGDRNSGNGNTGGFNSCENSNGYFCNEEDDNIRIFNIPSGMSLSEFRDSEYYDALISSPFKLTEWIEYTDKEKKEDINKAMMGGYLKKYTYKDACKNWWNNMTKENKKIILSIPNFDKDVFENITGIKI